VVRKNSDGADGTWFLNEAQNGTRQNVDSHIPHVLLQYRPGHIDQPAIEGCLSHDTIESTWHIIITLESEQVPRAF